MEKKCQDTFIELNESLKEIKKEIQKQNITLTRNTSSLEMHMIRSDRLENIIEKVEDRSYTLTKDLYKLIGVVTVVQVLIPVVLRFFGI